MIGHTEAQEHITEGLDITRYSDYLKKTLRYTLKTAIDEYNTGTIQSIKASRVFTLLEIAILPGQPVEEIESWNSFILKKENEIVIEGTYGKKNINEMEFSRFMSYLNALYISLEIQSTTSSNAENAASGIKSIISKTMQE